MTNVTCDRCGKEIYRPFASQQAKQPIYSIKKFGILANISSIDLCDECEKEFIIWLHGKQEDEDGR